MVSSMERSSASSSCINLSKPKMDHTAKKRKITNSNRTTQGKKVNMDKDDKCKGSEGEDVLGGGEDKGVGKKDETKPTQSEKKNPPKDKAAKEADPAKLLTNPACLRSLMDAFKALQMEISKHKAHNLSPDASEESNKDDDFTRKLPTRLAKLKSKPIIDTTSSEVEEVEEKAKKKNVFASCKRWQQKPNTRIQTTTMNWNLVLKKSSMGRGTSSMARTQGMHLPV